MRSIWIRMGAWFSTIHHRRLMARLDASIRAQRTHLALIQELECDVLTPDGKRWIQTEKERLILIVSHLEGLKKELKTSDTSFMYI